MCLRRTDLVAESNRRPNPRRIPISRQLKYLKVENEVLRARLLNRIIVTPKERQRLLKFGRNLGKALRTIVTPETFLRWIREDKKLGKRKVAAKRGRRRTPEQIRNLIIKIAKETGWGYTRILGELKKLGIRAITRSTVKNILKEHGLDPGPKRGEGTWDDFLKQHAASLWQCDFLSQKVLTIKGICEVFMIAFLHVETRLAIVTPATFHPDEAWVLEQAEKFMSEVRNSGLRVATVQHDRDTKFTKSFDQTLKRKRVATKVGAYRSPNTNAFVERFIQSIQQECLDHFLVFGAKHCDVLVREYLEHYHTERPHQGRGNEVLDVGRKRGRPKADHGKIEEQLAQLGEMRCNSALGGLLKTYRRVA